MLSDWPAIVGARPCGRWGTAGVTTTFVSPAGAGSYGNFSKKVTEVQLVITFSIVLGFHKTNNNQVA
mgnify:CR=1 FL=1